MKKKTAFEPSYLKYAGYINRMDAHHKLYTSLLVSLIMFIAIYGNLSIFTNLMLTWLAYLVSSLALAWITILTSHPSEVKHKAHAQDSSRTLVFSFVVAATFASLFAVLFLLQGASDSEKSGLNLPFLIPLACVFGSWWLVHTVFTLRYAHFYYCDMDHDDNGITMKPGGLLFPNEKEPDYLDFTYFSFVLGMTFQVSDVQITSRKIRRLAWMHGVLSFAFNTIIVAFTINIIAGLIQK